MIFVVSGPGGVGKGTIVDRLCERVPDLWVSRSWTTRARRRGEPETAYTFVDRREFREREKAGGFLEWAELEANHELYGTPWPDAPDGTDVLLEIDLQGAAQVRERHPEAVVILVVAPSEEIQASRMRSRGDGEEHVQARLALGREEERMGRALADHVVVNDDLERAVDEVAGILAGHPRTSGDQAWP
ncbi:MAG TPA: guanylate kinase [Acidimicrobiales bacterium]|nr:guanylate kinase [Acidimicrobiales bacterium]